MANFINIGSLKVFSPEKMLFLVQTSVVHTDLVLMWSLEWRVASRVLLYRAHSDGKNIVATFRLFKF